MKNLKHTLGPWIFEGPIQDTTGTCDIITEDKIVARVTAYEFYNCTISESNANAKLIAAAPELLEALQILLKSHRQLTFQQNNNINDTPIEQKAQEAINKAIGHE